MNLWLPIKKKVNSIQEITKSTVQIFDELEEGEGSSQASQSSLAIWEIDDD